jgi:hypothetical protein
MEPFRAECFVMEEDHVFFQADRRSIAIEAHLLSDSAYCCIGADQARKLAAWLTKAAEHLDAMAAMTDA